MQAAGHRMPAAGCRAQAAAEMSYLESERPEHRLRQGPSGLGPRRRRLQEVAQSYGLISSSRSIKTTLHYTTLHTLIVYWDMAWYVLHFRGFNINKTIQDGGDADAPLCPNWLNGIV